MAANAWAEWLLFSDLWASPAGNVVAAPFGLRFLPSLNAFVQPVVLVASMVGYLAVLAGLKAWMGAARPPLQLKWLMRLYNLCQIMLCGYMTVGMAKVLWNAPTLPAVAGVPVPNVFGISLALRADAEWLVFVHYVSKLLDFFDTVFIILRRKTEQLTFLHQYHHATIGPVWGLLLLVGFGSGTAVFGAFINSFIHVLMYTHYLVTSFGINNPLKKYLTIAQICQFYFCITHAAVVVLVPWEQHYIRGLALLQLAYHMSMIFLFTTFYTKNYAVKAKRGAVPKKD